MPLYFYRAKDAEGATYTGTIEAGTPAEVVSILGAAGYVVTALRPYDPYRWKRLLSYQPVSARDLAVFCRQLAVMLRGHFQLTRALDLLALQTQNTRMRDVAVDLRKEVERGRAFHEALRQHPEVFPEVFVSMVEAAEEGGLLDEVLTLLARHYEKEDAVLKKVRTASAYPLVVMAFGVIVVAFMVSYVLPKFSKLFLGLGAALPWPTRLLLEVGSFLQHRYPYVLGFAVLAALGCWLLRRSNTGRDWWDRAVLKMPVLGPLCLKVAVYRFGRVLGSLVRAGVPIVRALEVVASTVGNRVIASAITAARTNVRAGEPIAAPLAATGVFPPIVTEMIAVGESTGNLDEMLHQVAAYAEDELNYTLDNLTAMLEPVLILVVAGMVGFIVLSMFLPIVTAWKVLETFR